MTKMTPNLIVKSIEASLPFWVDRLGFEKLVEAPHGDKLGFVILQRGNAELMLQSRASLKEDVEEIAGGPHGAWCISRSTTWMRCASVERISAGDSGAHHGVWRARDHRARPGRTRGVLGVPRSAAMSGGM